MAAVITSPAARGRFAVDPGAFTIEFELDRLNAERLARMAPDLSELTGAFVAKRATMLRWFARRTLWLLGAQATALVQAFIDGHPAGELLHDEVESFGNFVVDQAAALRDGSAWSDVVAEMARFERARNASFWDAIELYDDRSDLVSEGPAVELAAGAKIDKFERDLRALYHSRLMPADPPPLDPCVLCFVHSLVASAFRIVRLTEDEARLLTSLPLPQTETIPRRLARLGLVVAA